MAMIDLSGVYKVTAKGKTYYYAWRGKGAPRLESEPGSPAFIVELQAAQATRKTGDKARMSGLCAMYRASDDWKELSDKTRRDWVIWLDRIQTEFGVLRIEQFDRPTMKPVIQQWRLRFKKTPRAADMGVQVLSRLLTFGMREGKLSTNACAKLGKLYRNDRAEMIWREADFKELAKFASEDVYRAARLAALTGLRQGDILRLSWSHIQPHSIEIRTGKSRGAKTTLVPLYGELKAFLETLPKKATTVLVNSDGRPWKTGFGSSWGRAVKGAKLDLHFHDLRGTAATRFYMAGLSVREIAQIMTWGEDRVESLINTYVKKDELLIDRIRRLDENAAST